MGIPINKFAQTVSLSLSISPKANKENLQRNGDHKADEADYDDEDKEEDDEDAESDHSDLDLCEDPLPPTHSNISVATFREILRKAAENGGKKYKVDSLVKDLDKGNTGFITFQSIQNFSGDAALLQTVSIDAFSPRKGKQAK